MYVGRYDLTVMVKGERLAKKVLVFLGSKDNSLRFDAFL